MTGTPAERKPEITLQQLADRKVIDRYGPPGVLVDEHLQIIQFRGHTVPFLGPSPGSATLGVLRMVRPDLLGVLKPALQRALEHGAHVICEPVVLLDDPSTSVTTEVLPLDAPGQPRSLLVLFRAAASAPLPTTDLAIAAVPLHDAVRIRNQQLERELIGTKEHLETIIQELATSNEELQSSNEELQSSNEELETSKEELQATNEELVTVNEELHQRILELGVANDDITNVFMNATSPVLLVGLDLRIRRFSTAAERLLHLIASDVGRPISYLGSSLNAPQIEATVSEAITRMRVRETRVLCSNGSWYSLHAAPYQSAHRSVQGAVIELVPIPVRNAADDVVQLDALASEVLAALPGRVVLIDASLRIVWVNEGFIQLFDAPSDILGRPLDSIVERSEFTHELWSQIDGVLLAARPFKDLDVQHTAGRWAGIRRWSARCIAGEVGRGVLTMLTISRQDDAR